MTPRDFIHEVVQLYHSAREVRFPRPRLYRGESHCVASSVEDLFGAYLIDRLPTDCSILINQTLTTHLDGRRERVKADIAVVRGQMVLEFYDLKMDLGYKRDSFGAFWRAWDTRIASLRGQVFTYREKHQSERIVKSATLAQTAKMRFILVSDQNISPQALSAVLGMKAEMHNSGLSVLSSGLHLNAYGYSVEQVLEDVAIHCDEFKALLPLLARPNTALEPTPTAP